MKWWPHSSDGNDHGRWKIFFNLNLHLRLYIFYVDMTIFWRLYDDIVRFTCILSFSWRDTEDYTTEKSPRKTEISFLPITVDSNSLKLKILTLGNIFTYNMLTMYSYDYTIQLCKIKCFSLNNFWKTNVWAISTLVNSVYCYSKNIKNVHITPAEKWRPSNWTISLKRRMSFPMDSKHTPQFY